MHITECRFEVFAILYGSLFWFYFLFPLPVVAQSDTLAVQAPIIAYHEGFNTGNVDQVQDALGASYFMFNGNYSGDMEDWQAHQYLSGEALSGWPAMMIREAGPFENTYSFVQTSIRGDAALVVTRETGRNRFRTWDDEGVTWMLGREAGEWRIVGLFIRDIRNPGSE